MYSFLLSSAPFGGYTKEIGKRATSSNRVKGKVVRKGKEKNEDETMGWRMMPTTGRTRGKKPGSRSYDPPRKKRGIDDEKQKSRVKTSWQQAMPRVKKKSRIYNLQGQRNGPPVTSLEKNGLVGALVGGPGRGSKCKRGSNQI